MARVFSVLLIGGFLAVAASASDQKSQEKASPSPEPANLRCLTIKPASLASCQAPDHWQGTARIPGGPVVAVLDSGLSW
jgi:hypothetical protein